MDENTALSLIQTLHNLGAILFAAGPFYVLLLLRRTTSAFDYNSAQHSEERFALLPPLWLLLLTLQLLSGVGFGVASLAYHGEFPAIGTIARLAISAKVVAVVIAIVILWYLWRVVGPEVRQLIATLGSTGDKRDELLDRLNTLQRKREVMVGLLLVLSLVALTGAAFLRWNM